MSNSLITFKKMKHDTLLNILDAMRSGLHTKREIQKSTGISWGTCSESINYLESIGLISIGRSDNGGQPGPKSSSYSFSRERFLTMGVEVAVEGLRITLTSLDGKLLNRKEYPGDWELENANAVTIIETCIRSFLKEYELSEKSVYTLRFALTGAIDRKNLIWIQSPKLHKINTLDFNIFYNLFPHIRIVNVLHDIQARATDIQNRLEIDNSSYVMLHIADGVGMAVREKGRFLLGKRGLAGELGHIPYHGDSLLDGSGCFCGQKDCLEQHLHSQRILDYYNAHASERVEDLNDMDAGEPAYDRLYGHIQKVLLYACRILVDVFDCSGIVLGGKSLEPWQESLEKDFAGKLRKTTWQQGPGDMVWYNERKVSPSYGVCLTNLSELTSRILRLEVHEI